MNAQGLDEPGIDGGGVFREFLSELLKTGFDPNHGYFMTTQDGLLYPNPQVGDSSDGSTQYDNSLPPSLPHRPSCSMKTLPSTISF